MNQDIYEYYACVWASHPVVNIKLCFLNALIV